MQCAPCNLQRLLKSFQRNSASLDKKHNNAKENQWICDNMNDRNTVTTKLSDTDPSSSDLIDEDSPGLFVLLKQKLGLKPPSSTRQQIQNLLHKDALQASPDFSRPERSMLRNILRFDSLRVDDVMLPRADIIAIDEQANLGELFTLFESSSHSRIPLYRETLDDPRGMVHIKDLMLWIASRSTAENNGNGGHERNAAHHKNHNHGQTTLRLVEARNEIISLADIDLERSVASIKIRRSMLYVPPSMPVLDLLLRMQSTRTHLAFVVDEYGGTDGLVSIEDLVEEVVGEIEDEHDVEEGASLTVHPRRGLLAKARTTIEELEMHLGYDLVSDTDDDDIDTLGGLVFALAKRVPVRGEIVAHPSGIEFEVLDADPRRIKRLRIHLPKDGPTRPDHNHHRTADARK
jgi:CBS domain containing-hemolysin-like protein